MSVTVPAAVRSLALAGRGTEDLRVTWLAAPGDVDHYEVQLLFNDMKVSLPGPVQYLVSLSSCLQYFYILHIFLGDFFIFHCCFISICDFGCF